MGGQKQKWTAEEEEALKAGVAKHGIGKWKNILTDPDFAPSLANRSNIDLKDKWRSLSMSSGAKLLRDCKTKWDLYVDGCDKHGKRIYDPIDGKCCHQCRQKTIGRHTVCSSCKTQSGQFCGDCLFMRYGENVIEVNKNSEWICPVCRGICNCSRCRLQKGWKPTGSIYRKVKNLGFKSVAHYLIQTRQAQTIQEEPT